MRPSAAPRTYELRGACLAGLEGRFRDQTRGDELLVTSNDLRRGVQGGEQLRDSLSHLEKGLCEVAPTTTFHCRLRVRGKGWAISLLL